MIGTMFPDNLTVPALRVAIIIILILCGLIVPTSAASPETLIAALPTASDVTPGLDMKNPPGITYRSDDPNYFTVKYGWEGDFRFTCAKKSGQIDSNPGDWLKCEVRAYSIDTPASAQTLTTGEIFREDIKERVEPYKDYPKLPDSVWYREVRTPSEYNYQVAEEIAFWVDQHTYVEVNVNTHVNSWSKYDEHGCTPSVAERKSKMEALVDSEAERIARLVWEKLVGEKGTFTCPVGGDAPLAIDPKIPSRGLCRGACGSNCPPSCRKLPDITLNVPSGEDEYYACTYSNVISCGSHAGCRDHDACYDRCVAERGETNAFGECHQSCDSQCTDTYGYLNCTGWIAGWPPYDQNLTYSDPPVTSGPFTGPAPDVEIPVISGAINGKTPDQSPGRPEEGGSLGAVLDKL